MPPNRAHIMQGLLDEVYCLGLHQASFDHVKVGPPPVLELLNLWRQIHMFLDILELRVEEEKNI